MQRDRSSLHGGDGVAGLVVERVLGIITKIISSSTPDGRVRKQALLRSTCLAHAQHRLLCSRQGQVAFSAAALMCRVSARR